MKAFVIFLATLLVPLFQGVSHGATTSAPLNSLVLLDVQGLWGGQSLWLREDGTAVVQVVTPPKRGQSGLQARRFAVRFTDSQSEALNRLLQEQPFATTRTPDRTGIPDEASPTIWVRTKAGTAFAAMKFANDKHKAFDSVYDYLLKLVETGKQGRAVYSGTYSWDWRPEGFPSWQEIHNLAVKDSKLHKQVKEK